MKQKQIIILAVILAFLVVGVVVRHQIKPAELTTQEYIPLDLSFPAANVAKIQVSVPKADAKKNDELVEAVKAGADWKIPSQSNARADQDKVDQLLKEIQNAKGELRGRDKSLFPDFKIGDNEAYQVKLQDAAGKDLLHLLIGAKKGSGGTIFIRKGGTDLVYLAEADLFSKIGVFGDPGTAKLNPEFWAATDFIHLDIEKINKMESHRLDGGKDVLAIGVERKADPADATKKKWIYLREQSGAKLPMALDADKIKNYFSTMKTWKATQVLDPKAKDYGFAHPTWRMTLGVEGGEPLVITAGDQDKDTKNVYLQVSGEPVVFSLSSYFFENFNSDDSHFFVENPLGIDPDNTEKFVLHMDKKEMSFKPKEKKWDGLTNYLNELKTINVSKLLLDPAEAKKVSTSSRNWIELKKTGEEAKTLYAGEVISTDKQYAMLLRSGSKPTLPFTIAESFYKKIFEDLDRLKEPTTEKKP